MKISKEFKLGIFVVVVLAAAFVVINVLRGTDIFGREITLSGRFDDVESLVASAPVQIRGYAAGRVEKVEYDPQQDNFLVVCSIDKRFRIPSDSRMMLYSTSIMGGKGIRIEYGESGDVAVDGAQLTTGSAPDLMSTLSGGAGVLLDRIGKAVDTLTLALSGVNSLLDERNRAMVSDAIAHLNSTLASANSLAGELGGKSAEINNLVDNLSSLSDRLAPLADSIMATARNAAAITGELADSDISGAVSNLNDALSGISGVVDNLNAPLTKILNDADSLLNEVKKQPGKFIKVTVF